MSLVVDYRESGEMYLVGGSFCGPPGSLPTWSAPVGAELGLKAPV